MTRKKEFSGKPRRSRFEQLDRLVPLLGLGIAAYLMSRAAADRRTAERHRAGIEGAVAEIRNRKSSASSESGRERGRFRSRIERLGRTKQFLVLAMLLGLIALVAGRGTFATFSAETGNPGSSFSSGTLTMSDTVNSQTVCNSIDAASLDNYKETCDAALTLQNLAPGATGVNVTSGGTGATPQVGVGGAGGYALLTIKNTGSIDASKFSLFAPYVNARLDTGGAISSGTTVSSLTVTAIEGWVQPGDSIVVAAQGNSQTFCAGAPASPGATSITISASSGSCSQTTTAAFTFPVGSRVNDTSTDTRTINTTTLSAAISSTGTTSISVSSGTGFPTAPFVIQIDSEQMTVTSVGGGTNWTVVRGVNGTTAATHNNGSTVTSVANTDCYDSQTGATASINGSTYGTQLNFNSAVNNAFCRTAVMWVQEQTNVGGTTYNYCWFGRGSPYGNQSSHEVGGVGVDALEDSSGQCRTPTVMSIASGHNITAGSATYSLNIGTLNGNLRSGDTITFTEGGNTMTCQAAQDYYIGYASTVSVNTCSGGGSQVYDPSATIYDSDAFTALNGDNHSSTISNFDTAHPSTGAIFMAPLIHRGAGGTNDGTPDTTSAVQLAKACGTAGCGDTRTFYIGVYFPALAATNQNNLQGLLSTFGLTWHIDQ